MSSSPLPLSALNTPPTLTERAFSFPLNEGYRLPIEEKAVAGPDEDMTTISTIIRSCMRLRNDVLEVARD